MILWIITNWKMVLTGAIITASFAAGWVVKGVFVDSQAVAIEKAKAAMIAELRDNEAHIANILEHKLKDLKANEKVIQKEVVKLIDRPVYRSECIDADGVHIIERARTGKTDSSKSTGKMSGAK